MKTASIIVLGVCLCVAAPHSIAQSSGKKPAQKKVYCWDQNGIKVCGDALPASAAAAARTEYSAASGRPVAHVERTLNSEERAAAAVAANQAQLAAAAEAARVRRDIAMVESYTTEADLRRAFNERIVLVDEAIKASTLSEGNLRDGLASLLTRAANQELAGKPVAKRLHDNILQQRSDLTNLLAVVSNKRAERAALDQELASALQRYRDLKNGAAASDAGGDTSSTAAAPPADEG